MTTPLQFNAQIHVVIAPTPHAHTRQSPDMCQQFLQAVALDQHWLNNRAGIPSHGIRDLYACMHKLSKLR